MQGDSPVLLEAPDTPDCARVMLAAVRERVSRAPVRLVVNNHHHLDHIGGLRHMFAAGIPVMTHAANIELLGRVAHASASDTLTVAPRPRLVGVLDRVVIGTGDRTILIYSASNFEGEAFLIGNLPALRLLWAADVGEGGRRRSCAV